MNDRFPNQRRSEQSSADQALHWGLTASTIQACWVSASSTSSRVYLYTMARLTLSPNRGKPSPTIG